MQYVLQLHCYGFFNLERTEKELKGLEEYFSAVVDFIAELHSQNELKAVLVSGAMENDQGVTEAEATGEELGSRLNDRGISVPIYQDRVSKSTIAIVRNGFKFMSQDRDLYGRTLVLACDRARRRKTKYLAEQHCVGAPFKVKAFKRRDTSYKSTWWYQWLELEAIKRFPEWVERKIEGARA